MGCLCCNKSSSEKSKNPPRKKKESKKWNPLACLVCRGEKAMCDFCCAKLSDENKESSSNTREQEEGKKRGRLACLACRGERAMGCSCCAKSSDEENNKPSREMKERKEGKKRNRLACLVCRGERVMGSSLCAKSSDRNKGSLRNVEEGNQESRHTCLACRGERVVGCTYCEKSSEENKKHSRGAEERKEKKKKDILACLVCRVWERGMGCSCCAKSSDENKKFSKKKKEQKEERGTEESKEERKEDQLTCLVCRGQERGIGCSCCAKSSNENKKSSRKTKERKEGRGTEESIEERKEGRLTCLVCRGHERGMGCSCCAKSSDENKKSSRKKEREEGRGTEERKEERKEDRHACIVCRGWERGMGCFCCAKSSDENKKSSKKMKKRKEGRGTKERKEEKKEDRLTCLVCRGRERGMGCFCYAKSSDKNKKSLRKMKEREEGRGPEERKEERKEDRLACLVCRGRERGMGCSYCAKSSDENKQSPRKTKERKQGITFLVCSGRKRGTCRVYCVKSSDKNKEPTRKKNEPRKGSQLAFLINSISFKSDNGRQRSEAEEILRIGNGSIAARIFQFREMAAATKNFRDECLLGEGGFGRVYKGMLEDTNQIVAVKQLDRNGLQGSREFLIEVLMLSLLHHPNLVKLLGYCADGDQRILVYEYMPLGSLEDHLLAPSPDQKPLDWSERMKIALGAAKGLEYLHDVANPPVIYRDFKASNILLDQEYNPKLSDFGLAKLGPVGDKSHVSTRVMGTYGYCAPEYALTGQLTKMSDVYSFGVLFLEMITGRRAFDITRPRHEQQLVQWAGPLFKDKRKFATVADPLLQGKYPLKGLYQAVAVSAMCLQDEASTRPRISDVVTALEYLSLQADESREGPKEYTAPQELTPPSSEIETDTGSDTGGSNTEEGSQ